MKTPQRSNVEFTEVTRALLDQHRRVNVLVRDIVNVGIVLYDEASNDQRAAARAIAYLPPGETLAQMPEEELRKRILGIVQELQALGVGTEHARRSKTAKSG